ncbi:Ceramide synthase hyl-1 [Pelomyxa schiedti]|nr:Ceramide synthase hyl-1 [Pelomyxa schiedti]
MYLVIYYVPATLFGWYALYDKEWVPGVVVPGASGDTRNCWRDLWNQNNDYTSVKMYYMFSLGYALQSLVFLIIRKHRRDFIEMAFHHALEVFLIVYSWAYGYVRIGTLVLALHDVGDVFVNVMRCTNEVRLVKTSIFLLISTIITWIWYRLWVFPGWVIHSTMFEAYGILINQDNTLHSEGYYFFNFMLCGLLALHWFWFYMFLKIAYHALFLSKVDDEVDVVVSEAEGHHHKHH